MQMQSTYWLQKVLKMISLYVNALLCTLQYIVIHAMQLSGVNSPNWSPTLVYETAGRFFVRHSVHSTETMGCPPLNQCKTAAAYSGLKAQA